MNKAKLVYNPRIPSKNELALLNSVCITERKLLNYPQSKKIKKLLLKQKQLRLRYDYWEF